MAEYSLKLKRQVTLLAIFDHDEAIIDLNVINKNVSINIRTLQRDIKELSAAGFLDVHYDHIREMYDGTVFVPERLPVMPPKQRKHFEAVRHFEKIILEMDCLDERDIEKSLENLHFNQESYEDWLEDDCIYKGAPHYVEVDLDEELSADKVYHKMFPESDKRSFQKDRRFLEDIGYPIEYNEELKVYYKRFPEELKA